MDLHFFYQIIISVDLLPCSFVRRVGCKMPSLGEMFRLLNK